MRSIMAISTEGKLHSKPVRSKLRSKPENDDINRLTTRLLLSNVIDDIVHPKAFPLNDLAFRIPITSRSSTSTKTSRWIFPWTIC